MESEQSRVTIQPEVTKMSEQLNCDSYKLCLFGSRLGC
jgi:hypothetical protein